MITKKKTALKVIFLLSLMAIGNLQNLANLYSCWQNPKFHLVGDHAVTFAGVAKVQQAQLWFGIPSFNDYWYPGPFWFILIIPFKTLGKLFAAQDVASIILLKIFLNSIFLYCFYRVQGRLVSNRIGTSVGLIFISACFLFIGPVSSSLWDPFLIAAPIALVLFTAWKLQTVPSFSRLAVVVCCLGTVGSMSLVAYYQYILSIIIISLAAAIHLFRTDSLWNSLKTKALKKPVVIFILANTLIISPWILDGFIHKFEHLRQYLRYQKAVQTRENVSTSYLETFNLLKNMFFDQNGYLYLLVLFLGLSVIVLFSKTDWRNKIGLIGYFPFAVFTAGFFIKFASSNFYSPSHPYYYLYFSLIFNCGLMLSWLISKTVNLKIMADKIKAPTAALIIFGLVFGLYFNRQEFRFTTDSSSQLSSGVIESDAFLSAYKKNQINDSTVVPITIDFQDFNPSESRDNIELPWRFAVGWSEFLQTSGAKTCVVPSKNAIALRGNYIMTMYMYTNYCDETANWDKHTLLTCNEVNQKIELVFLKGTRYVMGPCKS